MSFELSACIGSGTVVKSTDDRPLLVPGVPEVRKYRLRFWDKGIPNGDWCDLLTVTVGP